MKIVLSGGGTLGPVAPLLALVEASRERGDGHEFFWIGTERGVELPLVRKAGIETFEIPSGKFRRYFSLKNFSDLFQIVRGFFVARAILKEVRPDVVVSAGGYVSVPVHYGAWTLGIAGVVHQQDVVITLSNRLMSWVAARVTVSLEEQRNAFNARKTVLTGNPVRPSVLRATRDEALRAFHLDDALATVFIFGGGTGADAINRAVSDMVREYGDQFQVVHLTGRDRGRVAADASGTYHPYQFFTGEMALAYAAADVVVGRAGFNTICEAAAWRRPMILVPIARSHQEANAARAAAAGAAVVLSEGELSGASLLAAVRSLLTDDGKYEAMAGAARGLVLAGAAEAVLSQIDAVGLDKKP